MTPDVTAARRAPYHRRVQQAKLVELGLTKRRAVDLCRVAACLCRMT
jgi:hypothetical protein